MGNQLTSIAQYCDCLQPKQYWNSSNQDDSDKSDSINHTEDIIGNSEILSKQVKYDNKKQDNRNHDIDKQYIYDNEKNQKDKMRKMDESHHKIMEDNLENVFQSAIYDHSDDILQPNKLNQNHKQVLQTKTSKRQKQSQIQQQELSIDIVDLEKIPQNALMKQVRETNIKKISQTQPLRIHYNSQTYEYNYKS